MMSFSERAFDNGIRICTLRSYLLGSLIIESKRK
jgi:hypothetical protein